MRRSSPGYEEWRRAREPGEERRNWWDRTVGYFRWRWLIERRLPRDAAPAALDRLGPGERRELRLAFTPRRRGRIEMAGLTVGRPDALGLVRGLERLPLAAQLVSAERRIPLSALFRYMRKLRQANPEIKDPPVDVSAVYALSLIHI